MPGKRAPACERFWRHVNKTDGCWLWTGAIAPHNGYGRFGVKVDGKHATCSAHRFSWELHNGPIPDGMNVLHGCDTPACIRPDHLFLGTQAENIADMIAKGREARGSKRGCARLTEVQVLEARRLFALEGFTIAELSRRFGVWHTTMKNAVYGLSWSHI